MEKTAQSRGRGSREKGKRGERYVADLFKDAGYTDAHRSAQYKGNTGQAPDVENVPGLHCEVKFQEKMHLYDWMAQAVNDAEAEEKDNLPVVIHKQSRKDVLCTMRWDDWIKLYKSWEGGGNYENKSKRSQKIPENDTTGDG